MDNRRFDEMTRSLGGQRSRRGVMQVLAAGVIAGVGLKSADAAAQSTCIPSKEACTSTDQCCRGACVGNICDSTCSPIGRYCEMDLDCCSSLACLDIPAGTGPRCRPETCNSAGGGCIDHFDCCSGTCTNGSCVAPEPSPSATTPVEATPIAQTPEPSANGSQDESQPTSLPATSLPATGIPAKRNDGMALKLAGGLAVAAGALGSAGRFIRSRQKAH